MPTLTITVAAGPAARVAAAFGEILDLKEVLTPEIQADPFATPPVLHRPATYGPRSATMNEVTDHVRQYLKRETIKQEHEAALAAITYNAEPEVT